MVPYTSWMNVWMGIIYREGNFVYASDGQSLTITSSLTNLHAHDQFGNNTCVFSSYNEVKHWAVMCDFTGHRNQLICQL